ncbi:MAG: OsmC family protein [Polyangiaceae bacterium]|nr:OsmC family protein [Polyangiaceae bacterium]MCW5790864.1 OsmC family protein [Polyangiaceae bacterium]
MPEGTPVSELELHIAQEEAYRFQVRFGKDYAPLVVDEPPPLGRDSGPDPARLLAAAMGNCLAASLVFCLGKRGAKLTHGLEAQVSLQTVRTPERRLRVGKVKVTLRVPEGVPQEALDACRDTFEDFCTVTASVRQGIDVEVAIEGA